MSNDSSPESRRTLTLAEAARAFKSRDFTKAEALAHTVVNSEPQRADGWNLLALATEATGRIEEAANVYERGIASTGGSPVLKNNLALLLVKLGDRAKARALLREAVSHDPGYAAAWGNLGSLLAAAGETLEAEQALQTAVSAGPDDPVRQLDLAKLYVSGGQLRLAERCVDRADALYAQATQNGRSVSAEFLPVRGDLALRLALAQHELGNRVEELGHFQQAVELGAGPRAQEGLIEALQGVEFSAPRPSLKSILLRAFDENWGSERELGNIASSLLLAEPGCRDLLVVTENRDLAGPAIRWARSDPLLHQVLKRSPIQNLGLEEAITNLRRAICHAHAGGQLSTVLHQDFLPLCAAIAIQCNANGYAWAQTDDEQTEIDALKRLLRQDLETKNRPSAFMVALLGCYCGLNEVAATDRFLKFSWPSALEGVIDQQIRAGLEERRLRGSLPRSPADSTSEKPELKRSVEERPYPMWSGPRRPTNQSPAVWLKQTFGPEAAIELPKSRPIRVLVAGCGTGWEPVALSRAMSEVDVLGMDTSIPKLAYAIRKTRELGISNVHYRHGDVARLGHSLDAFDVVVVSDGLRHVDGPNEGLAALRELTKPGGYLSLSLYSRLGRRRLVEARQFAVDKGYDSSPESLRRFRHDVSQLGEAVSWRADLVKREEYYCLAMLRDLIFNDRECLFSPETIGECLDETGLQFCGFSVASGISHLFRTALGQDADVLSLKQWNEFEQEYPDTFRDAYRILCRRPA